MEYSLVLPLLMTIAAAAQGYLNDYNGTTSNLHHIVHNSFSSENKNSHQFRRNDFEEVFDHYRSESQRREPRFISFNTKDDNIEVEIDFAIPFLSIPVKRSLSGAMGTFQNVIKGIPLANINLGALMLTGFVVLGGAMISGISRLMNGGSFIEVAGGIPWFRNKKQKNDEENELDNQWWRIIDQIDKALLKYDFDTTACTSRVICWHVKDSLANVHERHASSFDHIISGFTSSEWALQLMSGTAWKDAVKAGRRGLNCESTYPSCKLSPKNLESFTNKLLQFATRRK